jgi:hypothetical protein
MSDIKVQLNSGLKRTNRILLVVLAFAAAAWLALGIYARYRELQRINDLTSKHPWLNLKPKKMQTNSVSEALDHFVFNKRRFSIPFKIQKQSVVGEMTFIESSDNRSIAFSNHGLFDAKLEKGVGSSDLEIATKVLNLTASEVSIFKPTSKISMVLFFKYIYAKSCKPDAIFQLSSQLITAFQFGSSFSSSHCIQATLFDREKGFATLEFTSFKEKRFSQDEINLVLLSSK